MGQRLRLCRIRFSNFRCLCFRIFLRRFLTTLPIEIRTSSVPDEARRITRFAARSQARKPERPAGENAIRRALGKGQRERAVKKDAHPGAVLGRPGREVSLPDRVSSQQQVGHPHAFVPAVAVCPLATVGLLANPLRHLLVRGTCVEPRRAHRHRIRTSDSPRESQRAVSAATTRLGTNRHTSNQSGDGKHPDSNTVSTR